MTVDRRTSAVRAAGLVLSVACATVLAACGSSGGSGEKTSGSTGASGSPIRIGVLAPLTGSVAADGQDMLKSTQLLVDQTNASGGIDGHKIEIVSADDACEAQQGTQAAQKLAISNVVAVVGGFCSSASLPAEAIFKRDNLPFLISVSSNPELTGAANTNVTRYIGRDDEEAPAEANYLENVLHASKIAIMNDGTSYSQSVSQQLTKTLKQDPSVKVVYNGGITPGGNDYRSQLIQVQSSGADALIYPGFYAEFGIIAKEWKQASMSFDLVGGDSTIDPSVATTAPTAISDPKFSQIAYPTLSQLSNPEATDFRDAFVKKFGAQPGTYGIFQADATQGLIDALKATNGSTAEPALNTAFRKVSFTGITGQISFNAIGDREQPPFVALRATAGGPLTTMSTYSLANGWTATS
jgi:ABC-type branched-subunit amino acid transport system substrate-binding protein